MKIKQSLTGVLKNSIIFIISKIKIIYEDIIMISVTGLVNQLPQDKVCHEITINSEPV